MKKIVVKLEPSSIDDAIDELRKYREGLLDKVKMLVGKLTQDGVQVARIRVSASQGDSTDAYVDYIVDSTGDIVKAQIFMQGTDALFIEFGAGIRYNNGNNHPMASTFGYGIGTYPSEHPPNRAITPGYWWYKGEDGNKHLSLGTEATMPIYFAGETVRNNLIQRAIEEFMRG